MPDAADVKAATPPRHSPWRRPDFRLIVCGETLSQVGNGFTLIGLPLLVLQLTHSAAWLGATGIAFAVPAVAGGVIGTALADRFSRRSLLLASSGGQMVVTAAIPSSLLLSAHVLAAMTVVLVCAMLLGTLATSFQVTFNATMPRLVAATELPDANAIVMGAGNAALLLGPALAGLVLAVAGITWVFEADAATYVASIVGVLAIRGVLSGRGVAQPFFAGARDGVRYVWRERKLRALVVLGFFAFVGNGSFIALLAYRMSHELHSGSPLVGVVVSVASAGGVVGSVLATRVFGRARAPRVSSEGRAIVASVVGVGIAMVAMGAAAAALAFAALGASAEALSAIADVGALTLTQRLVPDALLGRVMSVAYTLSWTGVLLSQSLMGILTTLTGATTTFLVFGSELVVGGGLMALSPLASRARDAALAQPETVVAPGGGVVPR